MFKCSICRNMDFSFNLYSIFWKEQYKEIIIITHLFSTPQHLNVVAPFLSKRTASIVLLHILFLQLLSLINEAVRILYF